MAGQWGTVRQYTSVEEGVSKPTIQCKACNVLVVPRDLVSTRYSSVTGGEKICPNCGHDMSREYYALYSV